MSEEKRPGGPDLTQDVRPAEFTEGKLFGHVADESASGAGRLGDTRNSYCSRYHGSLADGPVVDDTIRRPWHHACFSLRKGQGLRTTQAGNAKRRWLRAADARGKIVIVGGGAAGFAAAAARERRYSSTVSVDGA